MARPKRGGKLTTSTILPQLFSQQRKNSTETKYFGLVRDEALSDLTSAGEKYSGPQSFFLKVLRPYEVVTFRKEQ